MFLFYIWLFCKILTSYQIKIEPGLFYRAADELGLLVIQDMPSMPLRQPNAAQQEEFGRQLELMVNQLKSHPSIFSWVRLS